MTLISKSAIVPYTAENMFNLVNDIESYSKFLPWCQETSIQLRTESEVKATLVLSYAGMHKAFSTHNRMQAPKMIEVRLIEGPFSHLEGFWRFENLDDKASKVLLDLEFEFSNKLVALAFGHVFNQVANNMVDAFCKRAHEIYVQPN